MNVTPDTQFYCFILNAHSKHPPSLPVLISFMLLISLFFTTNVSATETPLTKVDADKIWGKSCFTCHGDSGDIARNFLKVVDGELQGPMHKETMRTFLSNHYLSKVKADAVYSMLLAKAKAKSRFEKDCGECHQSMSKLIYEKLALDNGVIYSKKSKIPIYNFLEKHRNLNKEDITYFAKKLTFRGYEIFVPVKME